MLNVSGNAESLGAIIDEMPFLKWIHSITAGVDHMLCAPMFYNPDLILTNAKGVYSESLAEYVIGAIMYFAKQFQRLEQQKQNCHWGKFDMKEIRGTTMGIVGYGDIGMECAKIAKAFGMRVIALRKRPDLSRNDALVDKVYDFNIHYIFIKTSRNINYVLICFTCYLCFRV